MNSLAIGDKLQAIKEIAIGGCEDIEVSEKIFDLCDEILGLVNSASCNCQHNSNSRDNEPCCRCESRQTHADRIRNMPDEEMAKRIASSPNFNCTDYCDNFSDGCAFRCNRKERELAVTLMMLQESIDMAIKALKKQIPKKPRKTDSYRGMLIRVYAYECPTCGNACLEKYMNERQNTTFCWNCGQKLDWSDAE